MQSKLKAMAASITSAALIIFLLVLPEAAAAAMDLDAAKIEALLMPIAEGHDAAFGSAVAPARTIDVEKSMTARAAASIQQMSQEIARVAAIFATAPDSSKSVKTRETVAKFSPETARDGASREFAGSGPSISVMRQVLFVPAAPADPRPVENVMQIVTAFEHSPKNDDTYYEYANPADLKGPVTELRGSKTSWTSRSQPPMTPGRIYMLKKCRHIFVLGWYCNTSLYALRDLEGTGVKALVTVLRPLPQGADNPRFGDDQASNIVDGYTGLYVVMVSGGLVLVYNLGIQSRPDSPSQQGRLNEGHKQEYRQLVERIKTALGTGPLP